MSLYIEFIMIMMIGIANLIILLVMWVYISREIKKIKFRLDNIENKIDEIRVYTIKRK